MNEMSHMPSTTHHTLQTIDQLLHWTFDQFESADLYYGHGTDNAWDEAVQLVLFVMQLPVDSDKTVVSQPTTAEQQLRVQTLAKQRIATRKPLAYLIQQAWFMGLPFYVDERVIVPRSPFAEWIAQQCQPWVDPAQVHRVCDLCTGSGCIAIAAAHVFPDATVDAIDIDPDALTVAAINIKQHRLAKRVTLIESDGLNALTDQRYDLILANPPYVSDEEMHTLPEEYLQEPTHALRADQHGLAIVIRLLSEASDHLTPQGVLIMEVGNSDEYLQSLFPTVAFTWLEQANGGHGLFALSHDELLHYQQQFKVFIHGR